MTPDHKQEEIDYNLTEAYRVSKILKREVATLAVNTAVGQRRLTAASAIAFAIMDINDTIPDFLDGVLEVLKEIKAAKKRRS